MKLFIQISLLTLLCFFPNHSLNAQQTTNLWANWDFLLGDWVADGKGEPGEIKGWFTLKADLDKNVLVRKNLAEYAATKDRPASVHEDLMIVYPGMNGGPARAIYFDNEKHVINYTVSYGESEKAVILTSEGQVGAPRFRFTYKKIDGKKIKTIFEIAPAGKPEAFSVYVEGTAHRKN